MTKHIARAVAAVGGDQNVFGAAVLNRPTSEVAALNDKLSKVPTETIKQTIGTGVDSDKQLQAFFDSLMRDDADDEQPLDKDADYFDWC